MTRDTAHDRSATQPGVDPAERDGVTPDAADGENDEPYMLRWMMPDAPDARVLASVVLDGGVDHGCVVHLCLAYGGHYWACTSCEAQGMDDSRGGEAAAVLDPDAVRRTYETLRVALASPDPVAALAGDPDAVKQGHAALSLPEPVATPKAGPKLRGLALAGLSVPGGLLPRVYDPTEEFERIASEWHASLGDLPDGDGDDSTAEE